MSSLLQHIRLVAYIVSSLLLNKRLFINLTPCVPLSKNGEGEEKKEGLVPLLDALPN